MNSRQVLSVVAGLGVFLVGAYLVQRTLFVGDVTSRPGELLLGLGLAALGVGGALLGVYLARERRHRPPRREPRLRDARPLTRRAAAHGSDAPAVTRPLS